jgi:hypothetical protein
MGGQADFSKKPSPHLSLMKTYPMTLISAGSISLDSTLTYKPTNLVTSWKLLTLIIVYSMPQLVFKKFTPTADFFPARSRF